MKRLMLIIAGLFISGQVLAAEYSGNPDRFPSIGVFLQVGQEDGDSTTIATPATATQGIERSFGGILFDLRIPVSNSVTFNAGFNYGSGESEAVETPQLFGGKTELSGYAINAGFRFYLNNSAPRRAPISQETKNSDTRYSDYTGRMNKLNAMLKQGGFPEKEIMEYEEWLAEEEYKVIN